MGRGSDRYVIFGLTPLAFAVARRLLDSDGDREVVVIPGRPHDGVPAAELPASVEVVDATISREEALRTANLVEARCLLSLTDDAVENLRTIVAAWQERPQTEVVIETFDQALADQLERKGLGSGQRHARRVHRAYSEASLAAPFFVAEALESENLLTMRFGDRQIPVYRTPVSGGSPLAGMSVDELEKRFECSVVAHGRAGSWTAAPTGNLEVREDDTLVLSGIASGVVQAASRNSQTARSVATALLETASGAGGRVVAALRSRWQALADVVRKRRFGVAMVTASTLILAIAVLFVPPPHSLKRGWRERSTSECGLRWARRTTGVCRRRQPS